MTSVAVLGVDTNILVRFFSRDDAIQSEQARTLITKAQNQPIHISLIALVELVWVLRRVKRWPLGDVLSLCDNLLLSPDFLVEDGVLVEQSLRDAELANCDLADALIARINLRAGCPTTVTFDQDAQRLPTMTPAETYL